MSKRNFRLLVLTALVCLILGAAADIAGESSLPDLLQAYEQAEVERVPSLAEWLLFGVLLLLLVADIVSTIGLLLFKPWAPRLFLGTTLGILVLTPLTGPEVATAWGSTLDYASNLATGAVMALVLWSPVREYFDAGADAV